MSKIINSICIGCGHLAQDITTTICCPDNKYVTIQEYLKDQRKRDANHVRLFKENKELRDYMQQYAKFAIRCDRKGISILDYEGWLNLENS